MVRWRYRRWAGALAAGLGWQARRGCNNDGMTRPELAQAIHDLSTGEKLDLLDELWDSLDHDAPLPEWHNRSSIAASQPPTPTPSQPR